MKEDAPAARAWRFGVWLAIGASTWIIPAPPGLEPAGWHVLGVFIATIVSFLLRPLPMGPMVLLGMIGLGITGTLSYKDLIGGYGDGTVWLVVAAFLIAGAVRITGFGRRVSLMLVRLLGRSTLGVGYAICAAELLLGPVVPSNTARGGGILAPIVASLSQALGSTPENRPERAGRYLVTVGAHANLIAAAMFLTGMAANPLVSKAASDVLGISFGWGRWALGAIVPGLIGLALLPLFLYRLMPPELKDSRAAQAEARGQLQEMGPWTTPQIVLAIMFPVLLLLWATNSLHHLGSGLVAWVGVGLLLVTGAQRWQHIIENAEAWDALIWLGGLLTMAEALKTTGVVDRFAEVMQSEVSGLGPLMVVVVVALIYFYSMYGFSMLTGHIAALVGAFFAVGKGAGAAPVLLCAVLAYFSNLCGCTTHYSTGPVVIYFGFRYVPATTWLRTGAVVSIFHLAIWLPIGLLWWKILGWW